MLYFVRMDRFALMTTFVRIVETGSLSKAARELRTTQPTISKQLRALEELTHARLLERNTRAIRLTEAGEKYFGVSKRILADLSAAESDLSAHHESLRGLLRISLSVGLGELHFARFAVQFQKENPDIVLDLQLTDRVVDLVAEGVDVAVRIGGVTDPDVVAKPLGFLHYVLCAAPAYLKEHGRPKRPQELAQHNYLRYGSEKVEILETPSGLVRVPIKTRFETNNSLSLRAAIVEGIGIGRCTRWLINEALEAKQVELVLPGIQPPPLSIHAVYLANRHTPVKVHRFIDFVKRKLADIPGWSAELKPSASR